MLIDHTDLPTPEGVPACRPEHAVVQLSHLVIAQAPFDEVTAVVGALALVAVPADDCAVTTTQAARRHDPPAEPFASSARLRSLARAELDLAEGPAGAAAAGATVRADDLRHETRWPRWSRRAAAVGIRSVLATPLDLGESSRATLLWVSDVARRFGAVHELAARHFAAAAGPALRSAAIAEELRTSRQNLEVALTSRATIDQAIGILVARTGGTPDDAWRRLRAMSQREHLKVAEIARRIVGEAGRRTRHTTTTAPAHG